MTNEEKAEMEARMKLENANDGIARSEREIKKSVELQSLFDDWKAQVSTRPPIVFQDDGKASPPQDYFAADGFFPGYFEQKTKVLFVGRESRWLSLLGSDSIAANINFFKTQNVNSNAFWRNCLYMLYGIQHEGKIPYSEVPYADEIAKKMVATNEFGFALMNISKYTNNSDEGGTRNIELMNRFLEDSELEKRNFFQEELELLEPDIIITANLWDCGIREEFIEQCFPTEKFKKWETYGQNIANYGDFELNGKTARLINTYHFSARKSTEEYFYTPVMKILGEIL